MNQEKYSFDWFMVFVVVIVALTILFVLLGILSGCEQDTQTGKWRLSPDTANQIGNAADVGTGLLGLASLFVPGLAGAAGIAAGVAGAYKKMKPGLTKYKKTSQHIVTSVENIKKNQPELWAKIKGEFKTGTDADIEQVIEQIVAVAKTEEKQTAKQSS